MIKYIPYYKIVAWSDRDDTIYDFYFPQGIEIKSAPPVRHYAEQELAENLGCPFEELPELLEESPELREELKGLITKYKAQFSTPDEIVWVEVDEGLANALGLVKRTPWESLPQVGYCNLPSSPEAEEVYIKREEVRREKVSFLSSAFEKVAEAAKLLGLTPKKPSLIYERGYASVTGSIEVEFCEDGKNFSVSYDHADWGFLAPTLEAILQDLRRRKDKELEVYYAEKRRKEQLIGFYENLSKESLAKGEVAKLSSGVVIKLEADGCTVRVPDWAVPHLIGKGGQKIKAASQSLGRRVKLVSYPDQNKPRKAQAWWLI